MEIYQPAEDSYLFVDFLKKYFENHGAESYLDMGTGSGVLSEAVSKYVYKKNIIAVDVNPDAVSKMKENGFVAIRSDLFEDVVGKFDLITFNAPYLPRDEREPEDSQVATTGGIRGDEVSVRFLEEAKNYLNKDGKIFLLISSLTPMEEIEKFGPKIVARKKIFSEELRILEFS